MRKVLDDRLLLSEALDLVGKLINYYPNGGKDAGRGYIGGLAATLGDYPRQVATKCCDRNNGVARETKFLPTISDLVSWCERETDKIRNHVDYGLRVDRQLQNRLEWQSEGKSQALSIKFRDWLDRTDPVAAQLSGHKSKAKIAAEAKKALEDEYGIDLVDAVPDA